MKNGVKLIKENKKAIYDYDIIEKFQAGVILKGGEVKSVKSGKVNIKGSYIIPKNGRFFITGMNISQWQPNNRSGAFNPKRDKELLLTKKELKYLIGKFYEKGLTFVPLRIYSKNGLVKLEFGIAKHKKKYNKKDKIKEREIKRNIERVLKRGGA